MMFQISRRVALTTSTALALVVSGAALADEAATKTPIKHLVVIFQENVSFDHYFATYPVATNRPASPPSPPCPIRRALPAKTSSTRSRAPIC